MPSHIYTYTQHVRIGLTKCSWDGPAHGWEHMPRKSPTCNSNSLKAKQMEALTLGPECKQSYTGVTSLLYLLPKLGLF